MMLLGNILYTVSSENTIKYSEIPIYTDPNKYNDKLRENYYILKGDISTYGDKLISESDEIFVINKKIDINIKHKFYTYITPFCNSTVGLIFGIDKLELKNDYYYFSINEKGNLTLSRIGKGLYHNLMIGENKYIDNYNRNNTYKMGISFNPQNGNIITSINDELIFSTIDTILKGNRVGFISHGKNTVFKQILSEEL